MTPAIQKQAPTLRFKDERGEDYPDWGEKLLGDIARFSKGKGISKDDVTSNGTTRCIRYGQLYTLYSEIISKIVSSTNVPISELVLSKKNDVIVPASGETALDIASAACVRVSGVALGGDINIIRCQHNGVFLAYYLNNKRLDIARLAQGISVIHLYSAHLKLLILKIPSKREQQKIANFLSSVDTKIEQLNQKKALWEKYKKGMMQKLFSQQIRFKDEQGKDYPGWEQRRLGQIVKIYKGQQLNRDILEKQGKYPVINGGVMPSGYTGEYNRDANTITISEGGNSCGHIGFQNARFWAGGHCYTLEENPHITVDSYLFQALKFHQITIMRLRVGSGLPNIQRGSLVHLNLPIPCPKEQQKIARFLSAIDQKIERVDTQIKHAQAFKKGLLQQMFI